jgi:hypothetical protein
MSRTFRLRHEPTRVARKFTDGPCTKHISESAAFWEASIVHGLLGLPCIHLGKPLVKYYVREDYDWFDVKRHSHEQCAVAGGILTKIRGKYANQAILREILESYGPALRLDAAPTYYHEYGGNRRRRHRGDTRSDEWYEKKADRRAMNQLMRKVNVTGDDSCI